MPEKSFQSWVARHICIYLYIWQCLYMYVTICVWHINTIVHVCSQATHIHTYTHMYICPQMKKETPKSIMLTCACPPQIFYKHTHIHQYKAIYVDICAICHYIFSPISWTCTCLFCWQMHKRYQLIEPISETVSRQLSKGNPCCQLRWTQLIHRTDNGKVIHKRISLFYVIISVATSTRLASPPQKQSHFTRQRAQAEKF